MTSRALVLSVRLHERRFYGRPEWPPSPARVFQALVSGASHAVDADPSVADAFLWLEGLPAPVVAAPGSIVGAEATLYVPNNDLDAKGGDPELLPTIRTPKRVQPRLLLSGAPFLYVWTFEGDPDQAERVVALARGLYQLGRGVDMAFAEATIAAPEAAEDLLAEHPGSVFRVSLGSTRSDAGSTGVMLSVPYPGTFESLRRRHAAQGQRFQVERIGKKATRTFVQPPKARFREMGYECPPDRFVFELRPVSSPDERFAPWPLARAHDLVVTIRDAARERLVAATGRDAEVDAVMIGTRPGGEERIPASLRARLIPLPSIGHEHADPAIRRVLVEVPTGGPVSGADIRWAFAGLVVGERVLVEVPGRDKMLGRFIGPPSRRWHSITAAALPTARRRIDPQNQRDEAKGAPERESEERAAIVAVNQALRHAEVRARATRVWVSRVPSTSGGERAEAFAVLPRFQKERLWHLEVELDRPVSGPLVLGDGRFLGLGLMHPVPDSPHILAWAVVGGLEAEADPLMVAAHFRRAVLSRAGNAWGYHKIPGWVSGHDADGAPAQGHRHLCVAFDPARNRLIVSLPEGDESWLVAGRRRFADALEEMVEVRAGRAGRFALQRVPVDSDDPLLRPSMKWRTVTRYNVNRHELAGSVPESVAADARLSLADLGFPVPVGLEVSSIGSVPGVGVSAHLEITFSTAVGGPLMLGRTRHRGGGLLEGV